MARDSDVVEIANGLVRGERTGGVVSFKGIPYAAPTAGANRFMAPRPVDNWSGIRDAYEFGDRSPQERETYADTRAFSWYGQTEPCSENCCVLNVFTPTLALGTRRPVMVYIHGGGYATGGGGGRVLDGSNLAEFGNVVVVTLNHRLNIFGYTSLNWLDSERFGDAGNIGQLDLIAALRWVRSNIDAFGGDPGNVTVFGQSGGGSKIMVLMGMPEARGLFHRAINMSGASGLVIPQEEVVQPYVDRIMTTLGITRDTLFKLQELPVEALLQARGAARAAAKADWSRPVLDGKNVLAEPMSPDGLALHSTVPLLMGTTQTEATFYLGTDHRNFKVNAAQVKRRICAQFGMDDAGAEALMDAYKQDRPFRTAADILIAITTDTQFRVPLLRAAEVKANAGNAPVYVYNFVWEAPVEGGVYRSPHTIDIPFAFGNTDRSATLTGTGAEQKEVSRNLMATFVAFACNGDPNNSRMPEWPPYNGANRPTMTIGGNCRVIDDFLGADRAASWDLNLDRFNRPLFDYAD